MEGYHLIAEEAARLASRLPASVIETVVARLERSDGSDWASLRGQIALAIPTPDYRGAVISLLDRWRSNWDKAESLVRQALDELVSFASAGGRFQRRLFVEDAKQGLGFVDVCRQRYDVVLMNPPFGESSKPARGLLEKQYPRTKNDLYAAFVEMGLRRLHPGGLLGAITSRTGFFLSSFQKWREEVLLREAQPTVFADLGYGVLDTAMVETAAYCLVKSQGGR